MKEIHAEIVDVVLNDYLYRSAVELLMAAKVRGIRILVKDSYAFGLEIDDQSLAIDDHTKEIAELLPRFDVTYYHHKITIKLKK